MISDVLTFNRYWSYTKKFYILSQINLQLFHMSFQLHEHYHTFKCRFGSKFHFKNFKSISLNMEEPVLENMLEEHRYNYRDLHYFMSIEIVLE